MATTLVPPTAGARPAPQNEAVRFVPVRARLLPDEIVTARQTVVVRRRVLGLLVAVAVLLGGLYALTWWQTGTAQNRLAGVQRRAAALQSEQQQFAPLVSAQNTIAAVTLQLQRLMVGDLSWKTMLTAVHAAAPAGVTVGEVTGTITTGAASAGAAATPDPAGGYGALNLSGRRQVGTLMISGSAGDKGAVADYADRLATITGLTAPFISSVSAVGAKVTFTVNVVVTTDALGGRYAVPATAGTGGK